MSCPYCGEPVNHGVTVCKTCRRDIGLVFTLQAANHALEERVRELEAELAELRVHGPTVVEPVVAAKPPEPPGIAALVFVYVILPSLLLIGAHYLLVIKFDTRLIWLRAASIVLPAIFGLVLDRKMHPQWFVAVGLGIVVAFVSVFGMSTMVHFTDGDAILPDSAVAWRETLEYITSISLSYLLGSLLARVVRPIKLTTIRRNTRMAKLAALIARHVTGRKDEPLQERIQRIVKLLQICVSATTAIGAIYTGFKSIL